MVATVPAGPAPSKRSFRDLLGRTGNAPVRPREGARRHERWAPARRTGRAKLQISTPARSAAVKGDRRSTSRPLGAAKRVVDHRVRVGGGTERVPRDRAVNWIGRRTENSVLATVEGASSYGAGIAAALTTQGFEIAEIRPAARSSCAHTGKSDALDAEAAARSVLGRDYNKLASPRRTGQRTALRMLLASRSIIDQQRTANRKLSTPYCAASTSTSTPGSPSVTHRSGPSPHGVSPEMLGQRTHPLRHEPDVGDTEVVWGPGFKHCCTRSSTSPTLMPCTPVRGILGRSPNRQAPRRRRAVGGRPRRHPGLHRVPERDLASDLVHQPRRSPQTPRSAAVTASSASSQQRCHYPTRQRRAGRATLRLGRATPLHRHRRPRPPPSQP